MHLIYQFERKKADVTAVKVISASQSKSSSTLIAKLTKKTAERDALRDDSEQRIKILMKALICHELRCRNKGSQC